MVRLSRFVVVAIAIALPACRSEANEQLPDAAETPPTTEAPAMPAPPPATAAPLMTASFQPASGSTLTGAAQVLPVEGDPNGFRVSVNLQNVPAGEHAWHIHQGGCSAKDAPVVVPFTADKQKPGIAAPITAGADGTVMAEATVPSNLLTIEQLRSGDYALHVHEKGGTDHGPSIACAPL